MAGPFPPSPAQGLALLSGPLTLARTLALLLAGTAGLLLLLLLRALLILVLLLAFLALLVLLALTLLIRVLAHH